MTDWSSPTGRHRLLSCERRRLALEVLADRGESIALNELASTVASREQRTPDVEDGIQRRVRISLHHVHLPKLDAACLCSYDQERAHVDADQSAIARLLDAA